MFPNLADYLWIAWIVLALVFIIIEVLTLEFTFLMLAAGMMIGGLGVSLLGGPWWLQVVAAAAIATLLLFTIRPLLLRLLHRSTANVPMNVDAISGLGARVTAPFVNGSGAVRLDNGETWTAEIPPRGMPLAVGARVVVVSVRGSIVEVAPESAI